MFVFEKRNSKFECLRIALFLLKYCDCRNADVMGKLNKIRSGQTRVLAIRLDSS